MSGEEKRENDMESVLQNEVTAESKNKRTLQCDRCPSVILKEGVGSLKESPFELPVMKKKGQDDEQSTELVKHYWMVPDMFQFENVGFSNTVGNVKFLTCADCEIGPIGWHDLDSKSSYVALTRVKYCN